jgi:predicted amidohydrolase
VIKISLVQFTPLMGDPAHNFRQIAGLLKNIETDLIVLPELCTTGYSFISAKEVFDAAEERDGESVRFFEQLANDHQAIVVAGFAESDAGKVYNSAIIATPGGEPKVYRKSHLFFREKECFSEGNTGFFVVPHPLKDCNIGVMICNDWRYPEAARSLALLGADIIACPSNLVSDAWRAVMPARAFENKVFLAVANRCGTETRTLPDGTIQTLTFTGGSVLYSYAGETVEQADKTSSVAMTFEIDPLLTRAKSFNAYNDLFNDRRPDLYIT